MAAFLFNPPVFDVKNIAIDCGTNGRHAMTTIFVGHFWLKMLLLGFKGFRFL